MPKQDTGAGACESLSEVEPIGSKVNQFKPKANNQGAKERSLKGKLASVHLLNSSDLIGALLYITVIIFLP